MITLYIIRCICDLSLYFAFFAPLLSMVGLTVNPMIIFAIMAAAGGLCCILTKVPKLLRLLPLCLLALCFVGTSGISDFLLAFFGSAYISTQAWRNKWMPSYSHISENFSRFFALYFVFAFVSIFAGRFSDIESASLPFITLWLVLSVYLMRILRLTDDILLSARYQIINWTALLSVALISIVISSPAAVAFIKNAAKIVYSITLYPLILLCGVVAFGLFWCVCRLILLLRSDSGTAAPAINIDLSGLEEALGPDVSETADLRIFFTIWGMILVSLIAAYFLRKMLCSGSESKKTDKGVMRESISVEAASEKRRFNPFHKNNNRDKVRNFYRRYLRICKKRGVSLEDSLTSDDIRRYSEEYMQPDAVRELRARWLPARYSSLIDITDKDVKITKAALSALGKHSK